MYKTYLAGPRLGNPIWNTPSRRQSAAEFYLIPYIDSD